MHSSERNKNHAHNNILRKISALKYLNDNLKSNPTLQKEYSPKTLRQFNNWSSASNSETINLIYPDLQRNANDTLRKYPLLRHQAESLIAQLREQHQKNQESKNSKISTKLVDARKYIAILEKQLALQQIQILETNEKYQQEQIRLNNIINELRIINPNEH